MSGCKKVAKLSNEITHYIKNVQNKLNMVYEELNWRSDITIKSKTDYLQCPFNLNHYIPEYSFKTHVERCKLISLGYSLKDKELPSSTFFYQGKINIQSIYINQEIQNEILKETAKKYNAQDKMVPLNNEIFSSRFLPVEKLAIHDTIIKLANDKKCLQHEDVTNEKCSRDARKLCKEVASRRNIPINNKNYNKMLKDVIGNQMTLFDDDTETSHDIGSAATSKSSKRKINKKDKSRHKKHKKHRKEK